MTFGPWVFLVAAVVSLAAEPTQDREARLERADELSHVMQDHALAGRHAEALAVAEEVVAIRRELLGEEHPDYATALNNLGTVLLKMEDPRALEVSQRTLALRRRILPPGHVDIAQSLTSLGIALRHQGKLEAAEAPYREAVHIWRAALGPAHPELALGLNNLGRFLVAKGAFDEGRAALQESLAMRRQVLEPGHPYIAGTMGNLGELEESLARWDEAESWYQQALDERASALPAGHPELSFLRMNLADLAAERGELARAQALMEEIVADLLVDPGERDSRTLSALNALGAVLRRRGEYARAREVYTRVVAGAREVLGPESRHLAQALNNLSVTTRTLGQEEEARGYLDESIRIHRTKTPGPELALALINLAGFYERQGDIVQARLLVEEARRIWLERYGPRHPSSVRGLTALAELSLQVGDAAMAEKHLEEALQVQLEILGAAHHERIGTLLDLAEAERGVGATEDALRHAEEAVAVGVAALGRGNTRVAGALASVGSTLHDRGDYAGARVAYEEALAIQLAIFGEQHLSVASTRALLGAALAYSGALDAAEREYQASFATRSALLGPSHLLVAQSKHALAVLARKRGDFDTARRLASEALEVNDERLGLAAWLGEREALGFVASSRAALDHWLEVHDRPGDASEAWTRTMRWKGAASQLLRERVAAARASDDPTIRERHERLLSTRRELAALSFAEPDTDAREAVATRLVELSALREAQERDLAADVEVERVVADAASVCEALNARRDGVVVDFLRYMRGNEQSYVAFVVRPEGCRVDRVELGPADVIDEAIGAWRLALASPVPSRGLVAVVTPMPGEPDAAARVRDLLWSPLERSVGEVERVHVVPDGVISGVPFAALPVSGHGRLVDRLTISYLDRADDLVREPTIDARGALIVGGLDFDAAEDGAAPRRRAAAAPCAGRTFAALPFTETEFASVTETWARRRRGEPLVALAGAAAPEDAVAAAMQGKELVHLATHGFFATDEGCRSALEGSAGVGYDPMLLSGLALSGANRRADASSAQDGILTAEEVATLDLRGTRTVVLSACATGLGEVRSGEGVLGLRRAFAVAGARTLVMSLWAVPDQATAELMDAFYARWLRARAGADPAGALRAAQLRWLAEEAREGRDPHPGAWAAFVVSGT